MLVSVNNWLRLVFVLIAGLCGWARAGGVTCYRCDTALMLASYKDPVRCRDPFGYAPMDGAVVADDVVQHSAIHIMNCAACVKYKYLQTSAGGDNGTNELQQVKRHCVTRSEVAIYSLADKMGACHEDDKYGYPGEVCYCDQHLCNQAGPGTHDRPGAGHATILAGLPLLLYVLNKLMQI